MSKFSNISNSGLSVILSSIISLFSFGLLTVLFQLNWQHGIATLGIFLISYFSIYTFINNYFYSKIKLIYKLINTTKSTKKEEYFNKKILPKKGIGEVKNEVEKWALNKQMEIDFLEKNNQYRKEFLLNLSHELRTPLFAAQGYMEHLLDGSELNEETRNKFLINAAKNIERLSILTDDLGIISRLESGDFPIILENFELGLLIQETFEELNLNASKKQIDLIFSNKPKEKFEVKADRHRIKQVLVNIIENAIKYCPEGSKVEIAIFILDKNILLIEITDNGLGIEQGDLERIFERFYRVEKTRNQHAKGTGLGLSIVKHIIEAHNQTITCRSKIGIGTTFGFTLNKL